MSESIIFFWVYWHRYSKYSTQSSPLFTLSRFSHVWLCNSKYCGLTGFSVHGILQARKTGVGCHALLQGIFSTQGWKLHRMQLLYCRQILYQLSHQGSPCVSNVEKPACESVIFPMCTVEYKIVCCLWLILIYSWAINAHKTDIIIY